MIKYKACDTLIEKVQIIREDEEYVYYNGLEEITIKELKLDEVNACGYFDTWNKALLYLASVQEKRYDFAETQRQAARRAIFYLKNLTQKDIDK